jgi:hypothetical protein
MYAFVEFPLSNTAGTLLVVKLKCNDLYLLREASKSQSYKAQNKRKIVNKERAEFIGACLKYRSTVNIRLDA